MGKKNKSKAKHFSEEQIRKFQNDPNVRYVDDHTLRFKYEFRVRLYEAWELDKIAGVKRVLTENGYEFKGIDKVIGSMCDKFNRNGRPSNARSNHSVGSVQKFRTNPEDNEYLISTGKFVKSGNAGIKFSPDFANELLHKYPEQSIEDGLIAAGIDPEMVGYQRIYHLKRRFDNGSPDGERRVLYTAEQIAKYKDHPYVLKITEKQFVLKKVFYDHAYCLRRIHIDEILKLFEFDCKDFSVFFKARIRYRLNHHERQGIHIAGESEQALRILQNVMESLEKEAEKSLKEIHDIVPSLKLSDRKRLCQHIDAMIPDPGKKFTKKYILKQIGISRSSFYGCLRNSDYGLAQERKGAQDEKDIEVIRKVLKSSKYPKGTRMIYMMMKKITGKQFGIKKIRRLKNKYGIECPVRKANVNRRAARELLERNRCENLLKRTFRLHRPLEVFLTDVTYIPYGDNQMAYGSAVTDSVTGRLMSFRISDTNNQELACNSLIDLAHWPHSDNALLHSDQGSLYLTDTFQNMVKDYGFRQSMSKRGNCWDNAPQESFFGHFKDETEYRECRNIYELAEEVRNYSEYYNFDRPQWTRNRMTPVQYQVWLENLDEEQFSEYLEKEKTKYGKMKEKAKQKAITRAQTLGV